jgi:hypothetical protein
MNVAIRRLLGGALVGFVVLALAAGGAQAATNTIVACYSTLQQEGARSPAVPPAVTGRVHRATATQRGVGTFGNLRILRPGEHCPPGTRTISWNIKGPQGHTGATGPAGPKGATVPAGVTGATGPPGEAGPAGPTGPSGIQAPEKLPEHGVTGEKGETGEKGTTGEKGEIGTAGATGATGPAGATGTHGVTGATGATGPTGASGTNGTNGTNGLNGAPGPAGPQGATGPQGPAGAAGASPTRSTTTCTTKITSLTTSTTTCTVTYTYSGLAAHALINGARARATITAHGNTRVIGIGRIRNHRPVLTFKHLRRGHHRLTLIELTHGHRVVIGHTTLTVS